MSPRKHVSGASQQLDTSKSLGIEDQLTSDYNFCLNREDEDNNLDIYRSVSQPADYYGMVGFDETDPLYELYESHTNNETDYYDSFSAQILDQIKDVSEETGRQSDDCETCLYDVIHSSGTENLDFENNRLLWLPPDAEEEDEDTKAQHMSYEEDEECNADWGFSDELSSITSKEQSGAMKDVVGGHFKSLILQLLKVENLPPKEENDGESWLEIITSLSWEVAALLKPDTCKEGGMDPAGYVKVKCLASGLKSDSMLVKGVVCKKNVAHRRMLSKIDKPRVLILGGALEYQRVSSHLSSVDTLLRQETEYLKMVVGKIETHKPNILLVENSVSRYAQEYLLGKNISLVLNIKRRLLERIAQCIDAQIVPSVDQLVSPKLGNCELFYVDKCFEEHGSAGQGGKKMTKNLMFFRDCPKPFAFTILLKGANGDELKKVKHVVQYGVFAAYHLALETSFLADEGASLPSLPTNPPNILLPDKPSHIKMKPLPNSPLPPIEPPQSSKNSSEVKCDSYPESSVTSPISSPLSTKNQTSPPQYIKHASNSDHFKQFFSSGHNDQFSYDLADSKETVFYKKSSDDPLGKGSPSALQSEFIEENDSVLNGSVQPLKEKEVVPVSSEQRSILYSITTRCVWKGIVCEKAQFHRIKYYGSFDKPLGRFLQDDLFDQKYRCECCEQPSEAHIYCYTHQQGSLTISVTKLVELILPGEEEGKIWMWHRCLRCPRINGFPPTTQRVAMSDAAWGFSFGKFLELSFSNSSVACKASSCGHSIHRDCLRFYGSGRMVACFRYAPIDVYSVCLPPVKMEFSYHKQEWTIKEATEVKNKVNLFFNEVSKALQQILEEAQVGSRDSSFKVQELKKHGQELEKTLGREKEEFEKSLKRALNQEDNIGEQGIDVLELNRLRRQLLFQSYIWDQRLLHAVSLHKTVTKEVNSPKSADPNKKNDTIAGSNNGSKKSQTGSISPAKNKLSAEYLKEANQESNHSIQRSLSDGQSPIASDVSDSLTATLIGENPPSKENAIAGTESQEKLRTEKVEVEKVGSPRISSFLSKTSMENSTSWLAMPFLNLYRSLNKSTSWNRHKLDSVKGYNPVYIMSFKELECQDGARLLLPVGVNDTTVAVYDDEPSSIITYSLLSPDYQNQVSNDNDLTTKKVGGISQSLQHLDLEIPLDSSSGESHIEPLRSFVSANESMISMSRVRSNLVLDPLFYAKPLHTRISFSDDGPPGKFKYTVVSYFARRFEVLRKMCCPSQVDFARSLSRCMKWGAQGGKSKVFFAKTPDDRLILKQVTKTELESFIKFAPAYFKYLSESINNKIPTCLAKILGVYQVSKQPKGGKETKMEILVMENLLYGRNIARVYDLKGSVRSRYNSQSSEGSKVLLDQNLIEAMSTSPIFVGNNAKHVLERAIWNDTSFLASVDVMDYSLLVGVDKEKHELVVGIIDFMRQYTWDKHLETWVKASRFLGGPKNTSPTVISPMQYKKRFRKAMSTYFIMVPDYWSPNLVVANESIFDICEES